MRLLFNRINSSVLLLSVVLFFSTNHAFIHPGIVSSRSELDFIRDKIKNSVQPWKAAFDRMKSSGYASSSYTPHPRDIVDCGAYSSPNNGCTESREDAQAAYTHALLWYFTGNETNAKKAIQIMDAWSAVLKTHTSHNAPLQAGWSGAPFCKAAEIIKHTYTGWSEQKIAQFEHMLRIAYLPILLEGRPSYNGNWELTMIDAMMSMAVFMDDDTLFSRALSRWRTRVPAYFYLTTDGPLPVPPPEGGKNTESSLISYWYNQKTFVDGVCQETCRDFGHLTGGLAAAIYAAETALHQGINLYEEETKRLTAGMEFHAKYVMGEPVPDWLCGGSPDLSKSSGWLTNTWEVAYNHFHNRLGLALPYTEKIVAWIRPTDVGHHISWETLTHAELGKVGYRDITASQRICPVGGTEGGTGTLALVAVGNGRYSVRYAVTRAADVRIVLFSTAGKEIAEIAHSTLTGSGRSVNFGTANLPAGIYIVSLSIDAQRAAAQFLTVY